MKILVADDDALSRGLLDEILHERGYEVILVSDGESAWQHLSGPQPPMSAILDWEMPGLSGPEICTRVVETKLHPMPYLFLLTFREGTVNLVAGLSSGAHDYITKPFQDDELFARLAVAERVLELQQRLKLRVEELEQALSQVRTLSGLLPICAWCKRVRSDQNYWLQVEEYLIKHTNTRVTHGICPTCLASQEALLDNS